MRRWLLPLLGLFFSISCNPLPGPDESCPGVDLREDFEVLYPNGFNVRVPSLVIPAGEEQVWCFYGTWEGPDSGIVSFHRRASPSFLHHVDMKTAASNDSTPDGTLFECTSLDDQAALGNPLITETRFGTMGDNELDLPEGVAMNFPSGSRYIADVHYVNTSTDPICVNAAFDLELRPAEEVEAMAAAVELDVGSFEIPPGAVTLHTECALPVAMNLLSLAGHMHYRGSRFQVDVVTSQGTETLYEVDPWLPDYLYQPPLTLFDIDEVELKADDTLVMECSWFNDTGTSLSYPDEMCQSRMVGYPLDGPLQCTGGLWRDADGRPMGDFGTIEGAITSSFEGSGDGRGDVLVVVSTSLQFETDGILAETFTDIDLSAPTPYFLEGLPLGTDPLFVTAFFDEDGSGLLHGPGPGDLLAPTYQVVCETTQAVTLDIVFDAQL